MPTTIPPHHPLGQRTQAGYRGFRVYPRETTVHSLPDVVEGPWPGASYGEGSVESEP